MGRLCNSFTGGRLPLRCSPLPTSAQAHFSTRMARIGFEPGIRTKMGRLCNFFTGGGLLLRRSPCSHHHNSIIPPEWPELAWSRKFPRRWVGCAIPLRGVDSRCDALLCPHQRKPIFPPEWPELVSSREFVRRWVGCAISLRGVDSCCGALLAHITTIPLSHPNGPNWLGAGNSPEDGSAVQFLYGG